jgi:hypothetical protein
MLAKVIGTKRSLVISDRVTRNTRIDSLSSGSVDDAIANSLEIIEDAPPAPVITIVVPSALTEDVNLAIAESVTVQVAGAPAALSSTDIRNFFLNPKQSMPAKSAPKILKKDMTVEQILAQKQEKALALANETPEAKAIRENKVAAKRQRDLENVVVLDGAFLFCYITAYFNLILQSITTSYLPWYHKFLILIERE